MDWYVHSIYIYPLFWLPFSVQLQFYYVHPLGGGHIICAFLYYLYQIWHAGLLG